MRAKQVLLNPKPVGWPGFLGKEKERTQRIQPHSTKKKFKK
jgi:hypothetical protein